MNNESENQIWHYGLMAELWAEFIQDTPELSFFQAQIEKFGQPVLDLASGTGRLLIPLLKSGVDIDGCDVSADMIHHCRLKSEKAGLNPALYTQPMDQLDLPRRYRLIYICGSIGLSGSRELDQEALFRCYEHLNDGGALVVNIQAEYTSTESWQIWLKEARAALPEPWPEQPEVQQTLDGREYRTWFRQTGFDPLEQRIFRQVRIEKWQNGRKIAEEEQSLSGLIYTKNELALILQMAGFHDISVYGDYTDQAATAESEEIVFVARKFV